jgi:hypothetical protein
MEKAAVEAIFEENGRRPDTGPIEDHLRALATERRLPRLAVAMCVLRIEEATPALCAVLARAADGEDLSEDEATLVFRGLYVLGAGRVHQALPTLLRLLHRPDDELTWLLGDAVTQGLSQIAAGLFDGDVDGLFSAIADSGLDQFVRDAMWTAAAFLTWEGRIDRDRMQRFLVSYYEDRSAEDDDYAWIGWLEAIAHLGMRELAPLVERAWSEGRVPDGVMDRSHFEQDLAEAERAPGDIERLKPAGMGYIEDILEALAWSDRDEVEVGEEGDGFVGGPFEPHVNPLRHVGRNDPCPCGSGKKFKKCCLST